MRVHNSGGKRAWLAMAILFFTPWAVWGEEAYIFSYSKYRDISAINQELSIERVVAEKVRLSLKGMNTGNRNETLDRLKDSSGGDFELTPLFWRRLELSLSGLGRKGRDEGGGYRSQTTEGKLSLDLSYLPLDYLSVLTSLGLGSDLYQRISSEGDTSIANSGGDYSLLVSMDRDWLTGYYSEEGGRRELTEERHRELFGAMGRRFNWLEVEAETRGVVSTEDYPTGEGKEEKSSKGGFGKLSLEAQPTNQFGLQLMASLKGEEYQYSVEEKGREIDSTGVQGIVDYSPLEAVRVELNLRRSFRHKDYRRDRSDEWFEDRYFGSSVEYLLEGGSWVRFEKSIGLSSYDLPHRYNFDDRDLLNESLNLTTKLLLGMTSLLTRISTRENRIIYIEKERSANNRNLAIYEFSNLISFSPLQTFLAQANLGIKADYTTYQFNPERNTLVRAVKLGMKLCNPAEEGHPYEVDYLLTVQDQGAYLFNLQLDEWRYRKDTQILKNELSLSLPLVTEENMALAPTYRLKAIKTFGYSAEDGNVHLVEKAGGQEHHIGLRGNVLLSEGSRFELSGERVIERGRTFWDLTASLSYNF